MEIAFLKNNFTLYIYWEQHTPIWEIDYSIWFNVVPRGVLCISLDIIDRNKRIWYIFLLDWEKINQTFNNQYTSIFGKFGCYETIFLDCSKHFQRRKKIAFDMNHLPTSLLFVVSASYRPLSLWWCFLWKWITIYSWLHFLENLEMNEYLVKWIWLFLTNNL